MKKRLFMLILLNVTILVLNGCSNTEVENSLASQLKSEDQIEKVILHCE